MELVVIAEGAETEDEVRMLTEQGVDRVQGFALARPMPMDALIRFMKTDFSGLCFTNLVDTDSVYGHRNDPKGFAGALEADVDKQFRVVLPATLREYAKLEKDIVTIGVASRLEIWDKEAWAAYSEAAQDEYEAVAEKCAGLRI